MLFFHTFFFLHCRPSHLLSLFHHLWWRRGLARGLSPCWKQYVAHRRTALGVKEALISRMAQLGALIKGSRAIPFFCLLRQAQRGRRGFEPLLTWQQVPAQVIRLYTGQKRRFDEQLWCPLFSGTAFRPNNWFFKSYSSCAKRLQFLVIS